MQPALIIASARTTRAAARVGGLVRGSSAVRAAGQKGRRLRSRSAVALFAQLLDAIGRRDRSLKDHNSMRREDRTPLRTLLETPNCMPISRRIRVGRIRSIDHRPLGPAYKWEED